MVYIFDVKNEYHDTLLFLDNASILEIDPLWLVETVYEAVFTTYLYEDARYISDVLDSTLHEFELDYDTPGVEDAVISFAMDLYGVTRERIQSQLGSQLGELLHDGIFDQGVDISIEQHSLLMYITI